jgi:hypothetical protein
LQDLLIAKMRSRLGLLASVTAAASAATSGWELPVWARGGRMWAELSAKAEYGNATANWFQQQVDHADSSKGTFAQKYYVDSSYYKPGSKMA